MKKVVGYIEASGLQHVDHLQLPAQVSSIVIHDKLIWSCESSPSQSPYIVHMASGPVTQLLVHLVKVRREVR